MAYGSMILKSEKKIFEIKNVWIKFFEKNLETNFYVVSKKDARDLQQVLKIPIKLNIELIMGFELEKFTTSSVCHYVIFSLAPTYMKIIKTLV